MTIADPEKAGPAVRRLCAPPLEWALLLALALGLPAGCGGREERPQSVILIVVDTLRGDLAQPLLGELETPTLDRLAADGVAFPFAISHAPITLPAHTALFSSRLPHQTGVLNNGQDVLPGVPLLAEHLRAHGYATRAVISMASMRSPLGADGETRGLGRGFDRYSSATRGFMGNGSQVNDVLLSELADLTSERPFFLFVHFSDPHEPYNAHLDDPKTATIAVDGGTPESVTTSNLTRWERDLQLAPGEHQIEIRSESRFRIRRVYLGGPDAEDGTTRQPLQPEFAIGASKLPQTEALIEFTVPAHPRGSCHLMLTLSDHPRRSKMPSRYGREIEYVDTQVGRLLRELEERDLLADSILIFTSDHGEALADRTAFIGHVHSLFDEMIRVPLVIHTARPASAALLRARAHEVVGHIDITPTLLDLLSLPPLPGQVGRSLLAPPLADPAVLSLTRQPEARENLSSLRDARFKLIYNSNKDRLEMFDLAADPGETRDIFEQHGAQRPDWPRQLRAAAAAADATGTAAKQSSLSHDQIEVLKALGYLGDE